jgi:hypothetical protein
MMFFPAFICMASRLPIRMMAWPFFLLTILFFYVQLWRGPKYLWIATLLLSVILCFMPFDVSLMDLPGPPRLVPYVSGYVDYGSSEDDSQKDFVSSDMSVYGDDVKWIWVW